MNKINEHSFSELYDISSGISTAKAQAGHGSPFVSFSTVFNNYFLPDEISDLMDTSDVEQNTYSIKSGDILLTRTSETIDELAMSCVVLKDYPHATFSGFTKRLRPKTQGIAYDKYLGFYLRGYLFRQAVTNHSIMTLRSSFNEEIFALLKLYLPEYEQQVKIGDFLYFIEQKIQTNNAINIELEKITKLYYDYWFVQFDFPNAEGKPYRASGGEMVYNEQLKREIPKGWDAIKIKDVCTLESGYPFRSETYCQHGKYKLITIKNVQDDGLNLNVDNYIDELPSNLPDYCRLRTQDILMSLTGNVGRIGLMFDDNCLLNQRVAVVRLVDERLRGFVFSLFKNNLVRAKLENLATGSSQDNLSPIEAVELVIPYCESVILNYSKIVGNNIDLMVKNSQEIKELTALRDFLLPLLMNGQITVATNET